jgi:hypothetical protein
VPVGVVVVELDPDSTVMVIVSLAPEAGDAVAVVNVVSDATSDVEVEAGQVFIRL